MSSYMGSSLTKETVSPATETAPPAKGTAPPATGSASPNYKDRFNSYCTKITSTAKGKALRFTD
jgi:hypothetical protein